MDRLCRGKSFRDHLDLTARHIVLPIQLKHVQLLTICP